MTPPRVEWGTLHNARELGEPGAPARSSAAHASTVSTWPGGSSWGRHLGSPDYYAENLRRWPGLIAAAIGAVADAPDGGVLVHCAAGRDRTGLVVALLLRVAGVPVADVLDDHEQGLREINACGAGILRGVYSLTRLNIRARWRKNTALTQARAR